MKHWKFILFFLLIFLVAAYGFDWPLKEKVVLSSFGEYSGEGFSTGIHLAGENEPVYPIAPGELIFSSELEENYFSLPYGLGNFMVLWHEGGIQSAYCQLKPGTHKKDTSLLSGNESIGILGDTGATIGSNLRLIIMNIEEKEILNPIKNLIPYYEDTKTPVIQGIYLKRDNSIDPLENNQVIAMGKGEILIKAFDLREDTRRTWETGPYHIALFHNGQQVKELFFDALREKGNKQVMSTGEYSADQVYEEEWMFKLGELDFPKGRSHIQARVSDFAGNTATAELFTIVE
jgi:hypothetical protein